jgi:hypothetical protein
MRKGRKEEEQRRRAKKNLHSGNPEKHRGSPRNYGLSSEPNQQPATSTLSRRNVADTNNYTSTSVVLAGSND